MLYKDEEFLKILQNAEKTKKLKNILSSHFKNNNFFWSEEIKNVIDDLSITNNDFSKVLKMHEKLALEELEKQGAVTCEKKS
jgi:hypothetical protein